MTLQLIPKKETSLITGYTTDLINRKFNNVVLIPVVSVWHTATSGKEIEYVYCLAFMNVCNLLYPVAKFNGYYNRRILVNKKMFAHATPQNLAL